MIIAVDGPSGTGKSSVARLVAERLGFSFFDTGALYRSFAWWVLKIPGGSDRIAERLSGFSFFVQDSPSGKRYFVGKHEVTEEIRDKEITDAASKFAAIREVRQSFLPLQREYGKSRDSVFEGRDVGSVVFPDAEVKIFLTARPEVRAKRRYDEIKRKDPGSSVTEEEILRSLAQRDERDAGREVAPLVCPEGAFVVDTSDLALSEVVEVVYQYIRNKEASCKDG